jgi:hypothetical protein
MSLEQYGDVGSGLLGFLLTVVLHVAAWLLFFIVASPLSGLLEGVMPGGNAGTWWLIGWWFTLFGLVQLIYLMPVVLYFRSRGTRVARSVAAGVVCSAAITFLLTTGGVGLLNVISWLSGR